MTRELWAIAITFVISSALTGFLVAKRKQLPVAPIRTRDIHKKIVPRIGGVAIFLSLLVVTLGYHLTNPHSLSGFGFPFAIFGFSVDKRLLAVLLGGLVLVSAMLYDDVVGFKHKYQKVLIQILVALIIIAGGIGVDYINNPFGGPEIRLDQWKIPIELGGVIYHFVVIADILTVLWLGMLMNVLNFSDGVDGLAGTVSLGALIVLMVLSLHPPVLQSATALLSAIAVGAVAGFLVWNLPPAKIFMGDTGSMFLGFLIGVLGIIAGAKLATTLVVLAIPIIDAFFVLAHRLLKGQNPFTHADQSHLHHRFLQAGFSVWHILLVLGGLSLLFGSVALQSTGKQKVALFVIALLITGFVMLVVSVMQKKGRPGG